MNNQGNINEAPTKRKIKGKRIAFLVLSILFGIYALLAFVVLFVSLIKGDTADIIVPILLSLGTGSVSALFIWLFFKKDSTKSLTAYQLQPYMSKTPGSIDGNMEANKKNINFVVNKLYNNIAKKFYLLLFALLAFSLFLAIGAIFIDSAFFGLVIIPIFGGFALMMHWPGQSKANIKYLLETNQIGIINEMLSGKMLYQPSSKIAFTETFFVCLKSRVVIPYQDVYWQVVK